MPEYLLRLSWPKRALWQNARVHWRLRSEATAEHKREAWGLALHHKVVASPDAELHFEFHPPDARRRDLHNMPATMKPAIDGIATAMGVDDEGFQCHWPVRWGDIVKGGCVLIHVKPQTVLIPNRGTING